MEEHTKKLIGIVFTLKLLENIIEIVIEEHPEIITQAVLKLGSEKKKCPKCCGPLTITNNVPDYWMCYRCIKGYTNEELKKKLC